MSGASQKVHTFLYNGARSSCKYSNATVLSYLQGSDRNVTFKIPKFIEDLGHIPDRYLDLLELASYVFCADRYVSRGEADSPYFTGWYQQFRHIVAVRDYEFWSNVKVSSLLESLLLFMSGAKHHFEFQPGHSTPKENMFDSSELLPIATSNIQVLMFSGGIDSTTGALDVLLNTNKNIILASHVSRGGAKKTQSDLSAELERRFPGRVRHLMFNCHLSKGKRAREETQRTRSFLYAAVGATIARAFNQKNFLFFENGVLSINLPSSEQLQNARATRTTHPKVLHLLSRLFSLVEGDCFEVSNPFLWMTKTDVIKKLKKFNQLDFLNNTVSCSRTFDKGVKHPQTHCGRCSQCIDRRFGVAASGLLEEEDRGTYAYDFVIDDICPDSLDSYSLEERTMLVDYIRLAISLHNQNIDAFEDRWLDNLTDVVNFVGCASDIDAIVKLHILFERHGKQVKNGILAFQKEYADRMLGEKSLPNSLQAILSSKEYLEPPARLLAERITKKIANAIPIAFKSSTPSDEKEVQNQVEAILNPSKEKLRREFPHVQFALGTSVPDFSLRAPCVYIEVKYIRGKTPPSKASEGIAADCTKYPKNAFLLFLVYDPQRSISNDRTFAKSFEDQRNCMVSIIR